MSISEVMRLAVLLDPVGEGLQAPVLDPADLAAVGLDDTLVLLDEGVGLLAGDVLPGKEHMFVKSHDWLAFPASFHIPADRRLSLSDFS